MKRSFTIIFAACLLMLTGCRVNNGDIGPYFGSWHLYDYTIDGETPEEFNPDETFWEFQNNIIDIIRVEFMYEPERRFGTWSEEDDKLVLNFTHYQEGTTPGTGQYQAPEWIGFPPNSIIELSFVERTSKTMKLEWHSPQGLTLVYSLRKIW